MGFRSTFTTEDCNRIEWPDWFVNKYSCAVWFNEISNGFTPMPRVPRGTISSKNEQKAYGFLDELHLDIQKAIQWDALDIESFILVFLHECGGITRCQIERDKIKWSEPASWRVTDGVEHDTCYGCSDV